MKRVLSLIAALLLVLAAFPSAFAAPSRTEKKDALVLMPLKAEGVDRSMLAAIETALVEGLQDKYKVYAGENVANKAREIFAKESRAVKKDCDETRCMQDIAMAFQSELIAVTAVTKRSDGYFMALSIRNIFDNTVVFSKSLPCKGCDEYQVVDALKTLAGGGAASTSSSKGRSAPSPPASPAVPSGDFSLDELASQAKAEEERKSAEKAKWDKYLSEMKKSFGQVEGYEKRDISKELKISAWEKFLKSYKEDDPYSGEDEDLREKAKGRVENIKNHGEVAAGGEIEMVFTKGGCFDMGDTFGDSGWFSSEEKPMHNVCIDDFYIGKYEATQRQWTDVMGSNPSYFKNCDDCPVESVSWNDVKEFINRLKQKTVDDRYRLPTEAEWEYAARSGGKHEKWAGTSNENELGEYAWYSANSGDKTHPVGQKRPNGLGLYDMTGNVWQWTGDGYDENYYKNSPKDNPKGPSSGSDRVFRGGSFYNEPRYVRTASRLHDPPEYRFFYLGFRLVRTR